eukprot:UN00934
MICCIVITVILTIILISVLVGDSSSGGGRSGGRGGSCFVKDTEVVLSNGNLKYIQDLTIGDNLKYGGEVFGVMTFNGKDETLYNYSGVYVAGVHPVYENNVWVRTENSDLAIKTDRQDIFIYDVSKRESSNRGKKMGMEMK